MHFLAHSEPLFQECEILTISELDYIYLQLVFLCSNIIKGFITTRF